MKCVDNLCETAIKNFREYLRIPTIHPNVKYDKYILFFKKIADELDLTFRVITYGSGKPIVIITWKGLNPEMPSILLNSHADVVPVVEKNWIHSPFGAQMDHEGKIFGRGAQDVKCVPIMCLEAIRRLICKGVHCKRTFHLSIMPDEEIGGKDGMGKFVKTRDFKDLNIGFALDEGCVTPYKFFPVFYGENICWQVKIHCMGKTGHGASLQRDTAGEKLRVILDKYMDYREKMLEQKSTSDKTISKESITVVNLTEISGGIAPNVIPDKLTALFDIRISIYEDLNEFEAMLRQWCCVAGSDVTLEFILKEKNIPVTNINCVTTNPFWGALKLAAEKLQINLIPAIMPGMSDSRYIRELRIPALGFTPINETPMLFHGDDEFIHQDKLLEGIKIYMEVLINIGNV